MPSDSPDRPLHVCHIITRLIVGGAQENTILTCEGLRARGHTVTLISGPTLGPEGSLLDRVRGGGYRFIEIPELVRAVRPWRDWRAVSALKACLRELAPDVVHTHSSKAGILGRLAARRSAACGVIHTIHGMSFNRTQSVVVRRLYAHLERRCAAYTDRIVTVADAMIQQSVAAGIAPAEKFATVYSGMEIDAFDPARYERRKVRGAWGVADDDVVVVTIARLFRKKGYEALIPIMARASAQQRNLRFVWIGDGAQRGAYERELAQLGLRDRTILTGLVRPAEIPRLLSGADIVAHASQWEGLPRAVVQGLLMCLPAVAFDIDGTPEVVRDGVTGRLIRYGDASAFAAALVDLARDPGRRAALGTAGRALCCEHFDWRAMVAQLEQIYAEVTPRRRVVNRDSR